MVKKTGSESPFAKFIQIGIVVRDMDKAVTRLESLGIGPFEPFDSDSLPPFIGEPLYRGKPMGNLDCKVYITRIGEIEIELFEPARAGTPWGDYLETRGEGIHHIAFAPDDLDEDSAWFTERGASVLHSARWQGGGGDYLDLGVAGIIVELYKPK